MTVDDIKKLARWRQYKGARHLYDCPIIVNGKATTMLSHLADIKQQSEGKWEYNVYKPDSYAVSYWFGNGEKGVMKSKEECMAIVDKFWLS